MAYGEPNYDISPPPWYGEIRRGTAPPQNRYQPPSIGIAPHYDKKELMIDARWGEGALGQIAREINQGRRWVDDGSGTTTSTTTPTTTPPTTATPTTGRRWVPRLPRSGGRGTPPGGGGGSTTTTPPSPPGGGGTPVTLTPTTRLTPPSRRPGATTTTTTPPPTRPTSPSRLPGVTTTPTGPTPPSRRPGAPTPVSIRRPEIPRPPGPGDAVPEWPTSPLAPEASLPPPVDASDISVPPPPKKTPKDTEFDWGLPPVDASDISVPPPPKRTPRDTGVEWGLPPMPTGADLPVGPLVGTDIPRPPGWTPDPVDLPRGTYTVPEGFSDVLSPDWRRGPDTPASDVESVFRRGPVPSSSEPEITDEQFLENFLNIKKSRSRTQKRPPKD